MNVSSDCDEEEQVYYSSLGTIMAVPEWEAIVTAITLSMVTLITVVGNILVILSVFTYKPLRIVQNFFIVSLAVADLTVALLVMPFNVVYSILGRWEFGIHACKLWLTCDVLCCTSSILNLCAIAIDRYWAITDPINYAQKRTVKNVLIIIAGVWILSLIISSPPLIGWNDWPETFTSTTPCQLTSQKGYVIYSALGSFFIPLLIMTIVYIEIFIATKRRLRERANAAKINTMAMRNSTNTTQNKETKNIAKDQESVSSETNHNEHPDDAANGKPRDKKFKKKRKKNGCEDENKARIKFLTPIMPNEDSITDNPDHSSGSHRKNSAGEEVIAVSTTPTTTKSKTPNKDASHKHGHASTAPLAAPKRPGGVYQFIEEKQKISLSKERRAARTLGIIMGVFVVCWLPFFLMYVILPFCSTCCTTKKFINFITWLGYVNSALNPIIYTIFNLEYRRAFKKLLRIK